MSAPVALDESEAVSNTERAGLSRHASCNIEKQLSIGLPNGQDPHASNTQVGFRVGELILSNGDRYSGTMLGNTPEGSGTYIWSDGCVYDGEWRRGMRHGHGKMMLPSGAVYEGEYSGDYIHGDGTYIGPDNLTYKGRWKLNLQHGLGYETHPNGDVFEGSWIQGNIEGPGKYTWANGNVYIGNMKGGKMSGKGTLTWKNGDSYEGNWLDGLMHGFGVYMWNDGGYYVGTWTRGLKDGKGAFYPIGCKIPASEELYINALRKRGVLPDLRRQNYGSRILHSSSVDMGNMKVIDTQEHRGTPSGVLTQGNLINVERTRNRNVSLERRWSLEVAIERVIGHDTAETSVLECNEKEVDSNAPILEREYMQGVLISEVVVNNSFSMSSKKAKRRQKKVKDVKQPGETIIKGHRSYDLMLSLQLGIRQYIQL